MAEFVEVMRQARRMCHNAENGRCRDCPLWDESLGCDIACDHEPDKLFAEIECIIMEWAEKNPVQPYPTWIEYQQEVFPNYTRQICPMVFGIKCTSNGTGCHECRNNPIPAEIAEKLGIKPKEG